MKTTPKLTGERLAWFQLASHLKTTVAALQDAITYSEFLEWQEFLRIDQERNAKEHFYLAQIAAEVRRANQNVKQPGKVKLNDFLLRFETPEEESTNRTAEGRNHRMALSKMAWLSVLKPQPKTSKEK